MSQILDEVLEANQSYAATFGGQANLPMPPDRHFAILTGTDARLDPAKTAWYPRTVFDPSYRLRREDLH